LTVPAAVFAPPLVIAIQAALLTAVQYAGEDAGVTVTLPAADAAP
jgi:hypothetical protein